MKRLLLGVVAGCCSTLAYSQATEIVVETYAEDIGMVGTTDLTGYNTYRVYVKFASDQEFLDSGIRRCRLPHKNSRRKQLLQLSVGRIDQRELQPCFVRWISGPGVRQLLDHWNGGPSQCDGGEAAINSVGDRFSNWIPVLSQAAGRQVATSSLTPRLVEAGSPCSRTPMLMQERTAW